MIETVAKFQTLIAGLLALGAAWAIVKEGKRERAFRAKQHEIKMQNKRRAVAVMLMADIQSGIKPEELEILAEALEKDADVLRRLDDGKSIPLLFFPPAGKLVLSNYSHYIEDMPLMRVETVKEVSQLYIFATVLFNAMEVSNSKMEGGAKMEGLAINKTRAGFLTSVSSSAKSTQNQIEKTLPLLKEEVKEAEIELRSLGVKEKPDASAPSS